MTSAHVGRGLTARSAFIVWAGDDKSRRSSLLAAALGIQPPAYSPKTARSGLLRGPLKYPRELVRTFHELAHARPSIVFVQSPPTIAVWSVALYCLLMGADFVVDAHSDAFQRARWTRPGWLNSLIGRMALLTLVTDEHWKRRLDAWGARAMVVPDIPDATAVGEAYPVKGEFTVAVVNSWSEDEPLQEVMRAAATLPSVTFYITGRRAGHEAIVASATPNVQFTDFLAERHYYGLLASVHAVVCLTTRDHTMQRGACEALSLGRPLITSDWPLLRGYFSRGSLHVDNTERAIGEAVRRLIAHHDQYTAEIAELGVRRRREWADRRLAILSIVERALRTNSRSGDKCG